MLLQYTAVFRQYQTARALHRNRAAPDRDHGRLHASPLDRGRSADLCLRSPSLRDSSRKKPSAHTADRRSHGQELRPPEPCRSFMDEAHIPRRTCSGSLLRSSCLPIVHRAQRNGFRTLHNAPRGHSHRYFGLYVAVAADKPDRRTVPACALSGKEHSPRNIQCSQTYARQKNGRGKAVSRIYPGNARRCDRSVCHSRSADGFRPEHRHFHQRGGIP